MIPLICLSWLVCRPEPKTISVLMLSWGWNFVSRFFYSFIGPIKNSSGSEVNWDLLFWFHLRYVCVYLRRKRIHEWIVGIIIIENSDKYQSFFSGKLIEKGKGFIFLCSSKGPIIWICQSVYFTNSFHCLYIFENECLY